MLLEIEEKNLIQEDLEEDNPEILKKDQQEEEKIQNDLKELLDIIGQGDEFNYELEEILSQAENLDLVGVQSQIMLLLKKFYKKYEKELSGKNLLTEKHIKKIHDNLQELSYELMQIRSKAISQQVTNHNTRKERLHQLKPDMKKRVKKLMMQFAIYELYKAVNPHRIAGETRLENFISNAVLRGVKEAIKYEGAKAKDLAIPKSFTKKIEEERGKLNKNSKKSFSR